ncbi:MAG TPA: threonylcarbamoyl-AMP synthase [Bacteroidetes bacterium]|nr:threonylcarbamoyl-AMP synthase [Bacteroidota bacterium]
MSELMKLHPANPEKRKISHIIDVLKKGGVIIYPTDTLYGLGCDITNQKAIERISRIKGIDPKKANFSFIIKDLSRINDYAKPFSNNIYKLLRKNLPGPFTFILNANNSIPKLLKNKKKTIGIRIPDSIVANTLLEEFGSPLISSSIVAIDDEFTEYPNDPEAIFDSYKHVVDIVIDSGPGDILPSTIVDCTGDSIEILRQGKGELRY